MKIINQSGIVLDAISHGPIEGLVKGNKSIYLDNTPLNTSNDIISQESASLETIHLKTECTGLREFKVPISSVQHIIDKEVINIDNHESGKDKHDLLSSFRYLWVEEAGEFYEGFYQQDNKVGAETDYGTSYAYLDEWVKGPFVKEDLSGANINIDAFAKETNKVDLFYTYTIDGVPGFRSYFYDKSISLREHKNTTRGGQGYTKWHTDYNTTDTLAQFETKLNVEKSKEGRTTSSTRTGTQVQVRYNTAHSVGSKMLETKKVKINAKHSEYRELPIRSTIRFDYLAAIKSIKDNGDGTATITCKDNKPTTSVCRKIGEVNLNSFILSSSAALARVQNFDGDYEFHTGELNQPYSRIATNIGSGAGVSLGLNKPLEWDKQYGGSSGAVFISSSGTGGSTLSLTNEQIKEVDKLKFTFAFPNGLYFTKHDANIEGAVAEFLIEFQYRRSPTSAFQTSILSGRTKENWESIIGDGTTKIQGTKGTAWKNSYTLNTETGRWDGNTERSGNNKFQTNEYHFKLFEELGGSSIYDSISDKKKKIITKLGAFYGKTKKTFAVDLYFDINQFKPFTDFLISVRRVTPDQHVDYNTFSTTKQNKDEQTKTAFVGATALQTVEAMFDEKLTYPNTAYSAIRFSGADFTQIPARSFLCRGLKVKVPSNYTTREEDTKAGGRGIAQYNRKVQRDPNNTSYPKYGLRKSDTYRFTFEAGGTKNHTSGNGTLNSVWAGHLPGTFGKSIQGTFGTFTPHINRLRSWGYHFRTESNGTAKPGDPLYILLNIKNNIDGVPITSANIKSISITRQSTGTTKTITRAMLDGNLTGTDYATNGRIIVEDKGNNASNYKNTIEVRIASTDQTEAGYLEKAFIPQENEFYDVEIEFQKPDGTTFDIFPLQYVPWDGGFRGDPGLPSAHLNRNKVYTNNPAWIYYDILTNKDYGLGEFIDEEDVDKFELYQIARYCDELVPAYGGGLEPRFTCNTYITKQTEAYKVLKDLASCFRGMAIYQSGLISAVQDRPKEPIYIFSQANVIDGLFDYEYTGRRARANQILVTWNDPKQNFAQDIIAVDDTENIIKTGKIIPKNIISFGCTSRSQAMRAANWTLKTDTLETEVIKFTTAINASFLNIGDIIKVQDQQSGSKVQFSGRLPQTPETGSYWVPLDREIDIQVDSTEDAGFKLHIQVPAQGVYLAQDFATINNKQLKRGDLVTTNHEGTSLEDLEGFIKSELYTEEKTFTSTDLFNLLDDNGQDVFIQLSKSSHIRTFDINEAASFHGRSEPVSRVCIQGSKAFPDLGIDLASCMWVITKEKGDPLNDSISRLYRVTKLTHNVDLTETVITGALYIEEKFDEVETIPTRYAGIDFLSINPSITLNSLGFNTDEVPVIGPGSAYEDNLPTLISNDAPVPQITGVTSTSVRNTPKHIIIDYTYISPNYEKLLNTGVVSVDGQINYGDRFGVEVKLGNQTVAEHLPTSNTDLKLFETDGINVSSGTTDIYDITLHPYVISDSGNKVFGERFESTITVDFSQGEVTTEEFGLPKGGELQNTLNLNSNTGTLTISGSTLGDYIHPNTTSFEGFGPSASTDGRKTLSFSGMTTENVGAVLFSKTEHDAGRGLLAMEQVIDDQILNASGTPDRFAYLKTVGASNNGLSVLTGTSPQIFGEKNSNILEGKNTSFLTDFNPGDLIKITNGLAVGEQGGLSEYNFVETVQSNTELTLKNILKRRYGALQVSVVGGNTLTFGHDIVKLGYKNTDTNLADGAFHGSISSITKANPGVVTFSSAEFSSDQFDGSSDVRFPIIILGGQMTELNPPTLTHCYILPTGTTTGTLHTKITGTANLDTTNFTTYSSGGYAKRLPYLEDTLDVYMDGHGFGVQADLRLSHTIGKEMYGHPFDPDNADITTRRNFSTGTYGYTRNVGNTGYYAAPNEYTRAEQNAYSYVGNYNVLYGESLDERVSRSTIGIDHGHIEDTLSLKLPGIQGQAQSSKNYHRNRFLGSAAGLANKSSSSYVEILESGSLEDNLGLFGAMTVEIHTGSIPIDDSTALSVTSAGSNCFPNRDTSRSANFTALFVPAQIKDPYGNTLYTFEDPQIDNYDFNTFGTATIADGLAGYRILVPTDSTADFLAGTDIPVLEGTFGVDGQIKSAKVVQPCSGMVEGMTFVGMAAGAQAIKEVGAEDENIPHSDLYSIPSQGTIGADNTSFTLTVEKIDGFYGSPKKITVIDNLRDPTNATSLALDTEYEVRLNIEKRNMQEIGQVYIAAQGGGGYRTAYKDDNFFPRELSSIVNSSVRNTFRVTRTAETKGKAYQLTQNIDFVNDAILSKVSKNSASDYEIQHLVSMVPTGPSQGDLVNTTSSSSVNNTFIYSRDIDRGKIGSLSIANNTGLPARPRVSATIDGELGYSDEPVNITAISSAGVGVFTTAAHTFKDDDIVRIEGLTDAQQDITAIDGTLGRVRQGSGELVTGSNSSDTKLSDGTLLSGVAVADGTYTNCEITPYVNCFGAGAQCTVTKSSGVATIQIDSITTAGSGYGFTGTNTSGTVQIKVTEADSSEHFYYATLKAAAIKTSDLTTHFFMNSDMSTDIDATTILDTSSYSAVSSLSGVTATKVNPLHLELAITAEFENITTTIPASSIDSAGIESFSFSYGPISFAQNNGFMILKEAGLTPADLKVKYTVIPGAKITQGTSSAPTYYGRVGSLLEDTTNNTLKIFFVEIQSFSTYANDRQPAIRISSSLGGSVLTGTPYTTVANVGVGSVGNLDFSLQPNTTSPALEGGGSNATFTFRIADTGAVTPLNTTGVVTGQQGSGYRDHTQVTFTAAALNAANSDYDTDRDDVSFFVDTNGTPVASADATLTATGGQEIVVDARSNIITPYEGSQTVILSGELDTVTTADYTAELRGYLQQYDGFEPDAFNLGSSIISIASADQALAGLKALEVTPINLIDIGAANSTTTFFGKRSGFAVQIFKDSAGSVAYTDGTSITDSGDPTSSSFVRGSNGFVIGKCATRINVATIEGELLV